MRDDIAALVGAWDKKTTKKSKNLMDILERLGDVAGPETVLSVEPCATFDPESGQYGTWGMLGLTDRRLIFEGRHGSARFSLSDIDEFDSHLRHLR